MYLFLPRLLTLLHRESSYNLGLFFDGKLYIFDGQLGLAKW